jgi:hypothetical protein
VLLPVDHEQSHVRVSLTLGPDLANQGRGITIRLKCRRVHFGREVEQMR